MYTLAACFVLCALCFVTTTCGSRLVPAVLPPVPPRVQQVSRPYARQSLYQSTACTLQSTRRTAVNFPLVAAVGLLTAKMPPTSSHAGMGTMKNSRNVVLGNKAP